LPAAVCPVGVVASLAGEGEEVPPAPGASALDEGLRRLRDGWQAGADASAAVDAPSESPVAPASPPRPRTPEGGCP